MRSMMLGLGWCVLISVETVALSKVIPNIECALIRMNDCQYNASLLHFTDMNVIEFSGNNACP
jgi:hypothetical protein